VSERFILDSSAVLCLLNREPGWELVEDALPRSSMSAVNLGEVVAKLVDYGMDPTSIDAALHPLQLRAVEFDAEQALASGLLRQKTRHAGLSLGDRACLALAAKLGAAALTADRAWQGVDAGVEIQLIR
jgi:PIN domain nuclease of toxin-antitoxin system